MADTVNESKAAALVADAEKKLAPSAWSFFSSRSGKVEEAAELFDKAGNFYKLAKNCAPLPFLALDLFTSFSFPS